LAWETNFLAGRFLSAAEGFNPHVGIVYELSVFNGKEGYINGAYQTWAEVEQMTLSSGLAGGSITPDGTGWTSSDGTYAALARASLAGDITVSGSPEAIDAYGWITAYATDAGVSFQQLSPQFDIAPRLPDGNYLTSNNIIVRADTISTTVQGSNADQLIYETGSGNVTIVGGTGTNILFAGSGSDTLIGGPGSDYLYGGSGPDVFSAGAGSNYMEAGTGADIFKLAAADAAQDVIADFKIGTDHLMVTDLAGKAASGSEIAAMISGATTDGSGSAVLHLSPVHDVTLQGIGTSQLSASMFG
jgi:Ca2+-binding RTX toxin-like protein